MKFGTLATLVVCTCAVSTTAFAQSTTFGVKAGFINATVKTTGTGAFEPKADITAAGGAFVGVELAPYLRLQPEVLISTRRFAIKNSPAGISVRTSGFEIPILLQVPFSTGTRARPVLYAGPQFSRISKVTQTVFGVESDISDRIKNLDAGIVVGGGIEIGAGRGAVTIDLRGVTGMNELSEDRTPGVKSRAFMMFAGYRF